MFFGRHRELELLRSACASNRSEMIPIYGRRRIGKSELIRELANEQRSLFFVGKTAPAQLQLREFLSEAARIVSEPLLAELPPNDWKKALTAVLDRAKKPQDKLVLVFDEFQWTAAASPELPSVLQELWDRRLSKSGEVVLILCGSYVGFMEREVLGKKSPLFGRRTAQIHLQPFDFLEAADFHPSWSVTDLAGARFLCGGVPMYLKLFDRQRSLRQNIEANFLDTLGPLFKEPDFLLREELREVDGYFALLMAVANGATTQTDIAAQSAIPERSLHYYLRQLEELGYLKRRFPLTAQPPRARGVRYAIADPMLQFWFRFVFPNLSFIQQMGPVRAFRERIAAGLDSYFGACFERLCREALPVLYEREGVQAAFEVGEFWSKHVQIDVVGLRNDGRIDLGECKWGAVRSPGALQRELTEKLAHYPATPGSTIHRRIFVRAKPKSATSGEVRWHDLRDLYGR
ncbi:MAG: ATP-binding protein [Deltaproteobacteria bacterium]|nr:ATP-binding protein [Deltaproteobacteria bacterium]